MPSSRGKGTHADEALWLYVEFGIEVDGSQVSDEIESTTDMEVLYRGVSTTTPSVETEYSDRWVLSAAEIKPWRRGFGVGEFIVRKTVTLKSGIVVTSEFRFPAR